MRQAAAGIGFWRSLRARLVLLVLLASTPLLAITLYTAKDVRNGEVERARAELQGLSRLAEGRLQQALQASEHLLHAFSQVPAIARGEAVECAQVFGHILDKAQRYTNFVATDAGGNTLCDGVNPGSRLNLGDRAHFKQARATKRFVVSDPVIGRSSGKAAMALAYPLLDAEGNFRGAILSGLDLQWFGEMFAKAIPYSHPTFSVWTADGTVIYRYPEPEQWVDKRFPETEITQAVLSRQADTVVVEAAGLTGVQNLYAITGIERWFGNRVAFSIGIPKAEIFSRSDRAFFHTLTYFGIVLVLTLAAAFVVAEYSVRRQVAALAGASERLAAGDLSARSGLPHGADELGALANSFDAMAEAMQRQIEDIRRGEQKIRSQLDHLSLLDQITRSTGERLDLKSIFQIVLVRLEDSLPIDFGCVCLYDAAANTLRVSCVGAKSEALARELMMDERATIDIDENGLSRCIQGRLVYEPDVSQVRFPFPARLARGGLGSLVMAPLKSESRVFGALVVARRAAQGFSSVECEFLRQLSEHVALAAHQAQLYGALQQAYDDLRQTQAAMMQEERLRALGQMASGIAHDINNALSPVSLYTESLLETEKNLSDRARGYLETIQRAVGDVAQTVARMREFYRQREQQLELTPVQMNGMVQQVLDLTRARWSDMPQSRGIVIRALTELAPDLPNVMGVESEIREALTNLVFNAVDAMPEGGTLTLRTRRVDTDPQYPAVAVEVIDTGAGMDEDTRRRCLEPFFTTKGERGTGLGLAMVFGMVQRHSAGLEIDSAPGAGTTVRLLFAVPAAVQTETGQPARALQAPSRLRLLLIDDDPMLLKALQDALETDSHVIVTANGGEAGVSAFRASLARGETFAAVITDLGMPYVDGRQVAVAVKEVSPATPVILLTGWGQRLVADNDIPSHVDRVLAKPPRLRELREALAQLCRPQTLEATT